MKLVSYILNKLPNVCRVGGLINGKVFDVQESYRSLLVSRNETDLIGVIDSILSANPNDFYSIGLDAIDRAKEAYQYTVEQREKIPMFDQEEITIKTPIPSPTKIICVGKNYADHVAEMKEGSIPEYPVLFAKFANALIGPEDHIIKSLSTNKLDYEVELAVVIGKTASNVRKDDAYDYIGGYTIANDITARDLQKRTPQWLQGKTLDRSTPVGPYIVTKDEVKDPANLPIRSFVNEEQRQSSNTSNLIFDIPFLIEFITNLITLHPGDLILTGTPDGVGMAMQPPQFLQDGDIVVSEIEGIGKLENKVSE